MVVGGLNDARRRSGEALAGDGHRVALQERGDDAIGHLDGGDAVLEIDRARRRDDPGRAVTARRAANDPERPALGAEDQFARRTAAIEAVDDQRAVGAGVAKERTAMKASARILAPV
jgi:hypothetical protein